MNINVEKFLRDYNRMCKTYVGCSGCKIREVDYDDHCYNISNLEIIAPIVQKWAEEHPAKTYLMDFREKFPHMDIDSSFYTHYCVRGFYGFDEKPESCIRTDCKDCWNRKME